MCSYWLFKNDIFGNLKVSGTIKIKPRPLSEKDWSKFSEFFHCSLEFDIRMPFEKEFSTYF